MMRVTQLLSQQDVILNDEGEVILEAEGMYPLTIDEVEDSK